jgi:hypothetical protein
MIRVVQRISGNFIQALRRRNLYFLKGNFIYKSCKMWHWRLLSSLFEEKSPARKVSLRNFYTRAERESESKGGRVNE